MKYVVFGLESSGAVWIGVTDFRLHVLTRAACGPFSCWHCQPHNSWPSIPFGTKTGTSELGRPQSSLWNLVQCMWIYSQKVCAQQDTVRIIIHTSKECYSIFCSGRRDSSLFPYWSCLLLKWGAGLGMTSLTFHKSPHHSTKVELHLYMGTKGFPSWEESIQICHL